MRLLVLSLYNLLLIPLLLGMLPGSLRKMRQRGGYGGRLGERFGRYSADFKGWLAQNPKPLWLHAVSVGEVNVAIKLVRQLRQDDPALPFVLSTTTPTAFSIAETALPELGGRAIFSPVDLPPVVASALDTIRPAALVLVEAEVWPNLTTQATRAGIPVILANARMSPRSESRMRRFAPVLAPIYEQLTATLVQEAADVVRWASIGIPKERIAHLGSIKYDPGTAQLDPREDPRTEGFVHLLNQLHPEPRTVLLGASTHPGEEALLAEAFLALRDQHPDLQLVLVPRHFERAEEAASDLRKLGLSPALRSQKTAIPKGADCLIVDSTGELALWTALADLVIIGKSFCSTGGQNPAEAAAAGKATVLGPEMSNFTPLVELLLREQATVQLAANNQLTDTLSELLADPQQRTELGHRARSALEVHRGATQRSAKAILARLPQSARE